MAEPEPIAIIGIGCRLPGNVGNPEDLWQLLSEGQSGWGRVPADRWTTDSFYHPDGSSIQAYNAQSGYFLTHDVKDFDSRFFGFNSREADSTDPQQRLLLETSYEALENAGIPIESLRGSDTAVYTAVFARDYDRMQYKDLNNISNLHLGGAGEAILSNRLSYIWDLKGASMTIDTGCSGSLVALHEACLALRTRQSRLAIVGGTELLLHPDQFVCMAAAGMLNSHGKCFTFDSRGSGYGRGEGVATVIIKRLSNALEDNDNIHAIIRNTASNQDGKTNGITLPNPDSQESLMRNIYHTAGLDPRDTLYVEAHGTGTVAGDAAEIKSIGNVFSEHKRERDLFVGSVKTNLGHTEATSGLAGLIKAVLVLQKRQIPPNLNFERPKPGLNLEQRQIAIPLKLEPLVPEGHQGPVRASVNSFGYGGTNCHVILERFEPGTTGRAVDSASVQNGGPTHTHATKGHTTSAQQTYATISPPLIFPLSASSEAALNAMLKGLAQWTSGRTLEHNALRDLSYTLSCRRSQLKWRQVCVASTSEQLLSELQAQTSAKPFRAAPATKLAFIFTGQGAQWARMGYDLLSTSDTFKQSLENAGKLLKSLECEWDLFEELAKADGESRMNESALAQPITTIIQMALVDLLGDFGIQPSWVVGHSSGEIAAAYAAGVLSDDDAIRSAFYRGKSSSVAKALNDLPGAMLATGFGEQAAMQTIKNARIDESKGRVTVACVNSPESTTLSGDEPAIEAVQEACAAKDVFARKLKVETAYHSHHMEKVAKSYASSLTNIRPRTIREGVQFVSSVTGTTKIEDFGAAYWTQNLVSQVRFNDAVGRLAKKMHDSGSQDAANVFVEIGPHSALQGPLRQILATMPEFKSSYFAPLARGKNSSSTFATAIARFFELGVPLDLRSAFRPSQGSVKSRVIGSMTPYPWNHQVKHWKESRLSSDYRFRQFPYHDLLGLYDEHSTIEEPRWRHMLSLERLPWLRHHVVDGQVIFPLTGYICMILEGLKQLVQMRTPGSKIASYTFKDTRIQRPVILAQDKNEGSASDVEVHLVLNPSKDHGNGLHSVRILSLQQDGKWAEHVSTMVRAELQGVSEVEHSTFFGDEDSIAFQDALEALDRITALARTALDPEVMYAEHREAGNDWGPSFALVTEANIGKGVALAKLHNPDISQWMPHGYFQPHLVHPATLDASSHILATLFHKQVLNAPLMPVKIDEFTFHNEINTIPGEEMIIACEMELLGKTAVLGKSWLFQRDPDSANLKLIISNSGLQLQAIGEEVGGTSQLFERYTNSQMMWKEDPGFLNEATFHALTSPQAERSQEFYDRLDVNEKAALVYLSKVRNSPQVQNPDTATLPHLRDFCNWISDWTATSSFRETIASMSEEDKVSILDKSLNIGSHDGALIGRIGPHLPAILDNTIDSLELMFEGTLLSNWYREGPMLAVNKQMAEYFTTLTHKYPQMSILEVGAGTGSAAAHLFNTLGDNGKNLIKQYCYTDISAGFFEQGKALLDKWKAFVDFKVLDITKDPIEQGFEQAHFDLVIASNVLHATPSMATTLQNVRKVLKPGGRMLMVEFTRVSAASHIVFGTLPGWWAFEDGRGGGPTLSIDEWDKHLRAASFDGVEFAAPDCDGPLSRFAFIVAKAVDNGVEKSTSDTIAMPESIRVVHRGTGSMAQHIGETLLSTFETQGLPTEITTWESLAAGEPPIAQDDAAFYVILDSANSSVLVRPSHAEFKTVQAILTRTRFVLWVTFQEDGKPDIAAVKALIGGLSRVARRENQALKLLTIEAKDLVHEDNMSELLSYIHRIAGLVLTPEVEHSSLLCDSEYVVSNSKCLIPRLHLDTHFKHWADRTNHKNKIEEHRYNDPELPLRLEVGTPGLLNTLHFVQNDVISAPLGDDQIQIEAKAYGINFRDVLIALGQMPPGQPMAGEVSGIVTAVGSGPFVQDTFKVGDRVLALRGQAFASQTRVKGLHAHLLPQKIQTSWSDAASIPLVFATVYYSLEHLARLRRGQTILIHAATGAVGQAAIQYAQHMGAVVIATASTVSKRQTLIDNYDIPESHILNARAAPAAVKRKIMRMTHNKGVDVVLNSIAGEMLAQSWDCIASFGMHIELGKADIYKNSSLSMAPFDRNVSFAAVDLFVICEQRPELFYELVDKTVELFDSGVFTPVKPVTTMPIDKLEAAFRLIAERKHVGKVVLEIPDSVVVQTALPPPPRVALARDGTYIIAGGLGDIGRRLIMLLASLGAGNIITLSRRKLDQAEHDAIVAKVGAAGSRLHVLQCDITIAESVQGLLNHCQRSLPPVRGILHSGMVLIDHPIPELSLDDWNTVLGPKVLGSWNLDNAFSSPDLDFFIMLSSASGVIGNPGQANYGAANNFQDAYARYHPETYKTRYTSLALPPVGGSAYIDDLIEAGTTVAITRIGAFVMSLEEILQVIEYSMRQSDDMPRTNLSIMGFDRQSASEMPDLTFWTPMCETLPHSVTGDSEGNNGEGTAKRDIEGLLKAAKTMDEAVDIIAQATVDKFAIFLNIPVEDLSIHQAPSAIGLDSLVSIELKNWIIRAFKATLQASELASAASILALAGTLAMRSKFVSPDIRNLTSNGNSAPHDEEKAEQNGAGECTTKENGIHASVELPRLPVPDLDTAMQKYFDNNSHLATSPEELETFRDAVQDFIAPDNTTRKIYEDIKRKAADPSTSGAWANEYLMEYTFLTRREPTQYTSFAAIYHPSKNPHTQAEAAAIIATTAFRYKKEIDDGTLEPTYMLGIPVCTTLNKWLFNTARLPGVKRDETVKGSGDYCVVMRRGRAFVVFLQEGGEDVPLDAVRDSVTAILDCVRDQGTQVGLLTSDRRDSWAKTRERLLTLEPRNEEYFRQIEAAAFAICLDDGAPETPEERSKHCRFGEGANRWHDKGVQFVVAANGSAGVIFEHSYIDGTLPLPLHTRIADAINAYSPSNNTNGKDGDKYNGHTPPLPQELHLTTDIEADSQLTTLQQKWASFSTAREFIYHRTPSFGQTFISSHNLPLKGVLDATMQLATHFYYGTLPPNWQPVALTQFNEGRHDLVQLNSPAVKAFCDAATDESKSMYARRTLMLKAARDINARTREAREGHGFFRLFHVIDKLQPPEEPRPAIYTHPLQKRLDNWRVISYINDVNFDSVQISMDPEALRLKYTIEADSCVISTCCGKDKVEDVARAIRQAVETMKVLITAGVSRERKEAV
ncbi:uncharacterized protein B0I36DRAFT_299658 [Microdochium trichocladiopsis]|uniref:Carrier domain-containing protein n=1 Tax=Microdochium trichocladiopsis TaxID=1682393 RepID=A0A9P9BIP0_9PEZI|nr:uncharacterized protein B0I36DRAFT_299658 [Microdochium trichocladiopsis]KAH7012488.1 hypothetical protein B0I36DRAFT_299658 [Microdochium trichocladiopsis]